MNRYPKVVILFMTGFEIFSAMTVYGFLSYEKGCVRIPNRELMEWFDDMLRKLKYCGKF